jgi:hypothetical protein
MTRLSSLANDATLSSKSSSTRRHSVLCSCSALTLWMRAGKMGANMSSSSWTSAHISNSMSSSSSAASTSSCCARHSYKEREREEWN